MGGKTAIVLMSCLWASHLYLVHQRENRMPNQMGLGPAKEGLYLCSFYVLGAVTPACSVHQPHLPANLLLTHLANHCSLYT